MTYVVAAVDQHIRCDRRTWDPSFLESASPMLISSTSQSLGSNSVVPPLDSLLHAKRDNDQGQTEPFLLSEGVLAHGKVTEIQGPPKSGKTAFLVSLVLPFLLPEQILVDFTRSGITTNSNETKSLLVNLGGKGAGRSVHLFDNDGRFPLLKLQKMMMMHIRSSIASVRWRTDAFERTGTAPWLQPSDAVLQATVDTAFAALKVWRPTSHYAFAAALQQLSLARTRAGERIDSHAMRNSVALNFPSRSRRDRLLVLLLLS